MPGHPAHVPLEVEAQAPVAHRIGDLGPGGGLLGDHHDAGVVLVRGGGGLLEEVDGLQVLPAAVLVGTPRAALPVIVQIQHGRNCIDSNSVDVKITEPVAGIGDEEGLHLRLAVIVDTGHPVWVLVHHRVGKLVAAGPVKLKQAVFVLREMRRNPV